MQSDADYNCYQSYALENVSQAPSSTGLYAWYATLNAGPKDWELEVVDGHDIGISRLRSLLSRQTDRFGHRKLEASATGSFSQIWSGNLEDKTSDVLRTILSTPQLGKDAQTYDYNRAPKLQSTLEARDSRQLMVEALESAIPILCSPIYVGVAECLKTRLSKHARDIKKLSEAATRDPDIRDRLRSETKTSFAIRAVAAGFLPANLRVWTLNLEALANELDVSSEDPRTVAEAAEWILNRWNRPYLGRR